ncbi:uncharacterized protein LOC126840641 [Adelges cooleyi]|uniref:uncharacterized protein LOC126840641 n=1 Tax=Adelges cooleyi TaxID=133065 RepID=UPI0021802CAD|nr:uncharacterized protein LOC126840641 [Adelges cooleyi]
MFTKSMAMVQLKYKTAPVLMPKSKKIMITLNRNIASLKTWGVSGMIYGVTGFVLLCYMTEWRAVLQYVPYYNGKYGDLVEEERIEAIKSKAEDIERHDNAAKGYANSKTDKPQSENDAK